MFIQRNVWTENNSEPVHLTDDPHGVLCRHLVQHIGEIDDVEGLRLQPAQFLTVSRIELNIGLIPELGPLPGESDVGCGHVNPDDLSLGENPGIGEGREARPSAEIKDPLGLPLSVDLPDPLLKPGLVQKVELGFSQKRDPDGVTIKVTPGQEVDKCFVEVVRDNHPMAGGKHVRVVFSTRKVRAGIEEVVEEVQVLCDPRPGPEGHQVGPHLKRCLL